MSWNSLYLYFLNLFQCSRVKVRKVYRKSCKVCSTIVKSTRQHQTGQSFVIKPFQNIWNSFERKRSQVFEMTQWHMMVQLLSVRLIPWSVIFIEPLYTEIASNGSSSLVGYKRLQLLSYKIIIWNLMISEILAFNVIKKHWVRNFLKWTSFKWTIRVAKYYNYRVSCIDI